MGMAKAMPNEWSDHFWRGLFVILFHIWNGVLKNALTGLHCEA
jgi:hypothetical protein